MGEVPWDKVINMLEKVGIEMTKGLKEGIEFTYPLAVRRVITNNLLTLITCILFLYVSYKLIKYLKFVDTCYKGAFERKYDWEIQADITIILIDAIIVVLPMRIAILKLVNYEWYAIRLLIEMLSK